MIKKILLTVLISLISVNCYGATVTRFVNTSSSGGDGTTNNESGATAAYASLSAWEAAEQTNLVADGDVHVVNCDSGSSDNADTISTTIDGWTTGASNNITINGEDLTSTAFSTGKYRMDCNDGCLTINENYVTVNQIQFKVTRDVSNFPQGVGTNSMASGGSDVIINRCVVLVNLAGGNARRGIKGGDSDTTMTIKNTVIYASQDASIRLVFVEGATVNVYNSTIDGVVGNIGIDRASGTATATNCAVLRTGNDFNGTITIDSCASDDGDGTNAQTLDATSAYANEFVDVTNNDYTLVASGSCEDNGANLSGSGVSVDFFGTSRPQNSTYDISAFEIVAAPAVTFIPTITIY